MTIELAVWQELTRSYKPSKAVESIVQPKGQVTLPKEAREELAIKPGDKVVWIRNAQNRWEIWTLAQILEDLSPSMDGLADFSRRTKKGFNAKRS
jgi:AbrB family looped-hinge helix DNA binding protein